MSIEIQLKEKEILNVGLGNKLSLSFGASSDFDLARQLVDNIEDPELKKPIRAYLGMREVGKEAESPMVSMSSLTQTDFSQSSIAKERQEFALAEEAKKIAQEGRNLEAIEHIANLETKLLRAHAFGSLAEIIDQGGLDATPVFILAIDSVRDYLNDPDIDSLDAISGIEITEQLLNKACELQYFNIVRLSAKRTLDQIVELGRDGVNRDFLISVSSILIFSAGVQKTGGLSDQEIKRLNGEDVEQLSLLNNDLLNQALVHFKLIK